MRLAIFIAGVFVAVAINEEVTNKWVNDGIGIFSICVMLFYFIILDMIKD